MQTNLILFRLHYKKHTVKLHITTAIPTNKFWYNTFIYLFITINKI